MKKRLPVSKKRSLIKAVTFRVLIIFFDAFVIFFITRRFGITLGIIFFSNIVSTILYFVHERVWNNIDLN
jgi:uncharacterized membrane protein